MGEVAKISDAQLAEMAKYAKYAVADAGASVSLPTMRMVNKDGDPNFGKWMVGRKRNDDGTIDPGKHARGMIILVVRRQFSYMNMNPDVKNCWSQMYNEYPDSNMFGATRGVKCNKCELRDKNRDSKDKCKCQIVVYNIAVLDDGTKVPCVAYISGSSFMPFQDYLKTASHVLVNGRFVDIAPFSFVTLLGAAGPRRNGAVTYYEGAFKRGPATDTGDFEGFAKKCDEIEKYVDENNAKHGKKDPEMKEVQQTAGSSYNRLPEGYSDPKPVQDNSGFPAVTEDIDDCPFDVAPVEPVIAGAGAKSNVVDVDEMEAMFADAGI